MDDAVTPNAAEDTPLVVAGRTFTSRLIIGTGKYGTYAQNAEALKASGADAEAIEEDDLPERLAEGMARARAGWRKER